MLSFRKNLTAGLLAAIPLWVTWLVTVFLLGLAVDIAGPVADWLISVLPVKVPVLADTIGATVAKYVISALMLVIALYCLGWLTKRFLGRRLITTLDRLAQKVPFVGKVYWGTKQVVEALQAKPGKPQQVVLIEYPHPGMKTIGLVTKLLKDAATGASLMAVYVPTTPNPTSGFLEIVPVDKVVPVSWSVNDAIAFIVSGGSVGPSEIAYTRGLGGASPDTVTDEQ